ncbi:MAG: leucine-rich repeat domain-containing protein [Ruminiclostridium sp.]|nr:leucine-rich repeat domain-containing protein [Ruminiclostridium sp.]
MKKIKLLYEPKLSEQKAIIQALFPDEKTTPDFTYTAYHYDSKPKETLTENNFTREQEQSQLRQNDDEEENLEHLRSQEKSPFVFGIILFVLIVGLLFILLMVNINRDSPKPFSDNLTTTTTASTTIINPTKESSSDFTIDSGVLTGYTGSGGDVVIPDGVTSIGNSTFFGCSNLESITIPDSVKSIGNYALAGCSSLKNVTIPNSVTSIGKGAFKSCSSLISITIPDSVTSIGEYTFEHCRNLESVTIPESVRRIESDAFLNTKSLKDIYYTGTEEQWKRIDISYGSIPAGVTIHYNSAS